MSTMKPSGTSVAGGGFSRFLVRVLEFFGGLPLFLGNTEGIVPTAHCVIVRWELFNALMKYMHVKKIK